VGHETDFTIVDFVADVRAPTPTAAAQLATADRVEVCQQLHDRQSRLARLVQRALENRMQRLDYLSRCLIHPGDRIAHQLQHLTHLANRLCGGWNRWSEAQTWEVRAAAKHLAAVRPDIEALERKRLELARRIRDSARARLESATSRLAAIESHLKHLNPDLVLERGYSIALKASGEIVRDAAQVAPQDELEIRFAHGSATTQVKGTKS
jgi:exodeoxyribonuclease VII large subunit